MRQPLVALVPAEIRDDGIPPHGAPLRRLLFEDDHDFFRTVITFLASNPGSVNFPRAGVIAVVMATALIAFAALAKVGGWQTIARVADPNGPNVADGDSSFTIQPDPAAGLPLVGGAGDGRAGLGAVLDSPMEGENYTFASMFKPESTRGDGETSSDPAGFVVAQNSTAVKGGAQSAQSNSSHGAGAAGPAASPAQPTAPVNVPDGGSSALLMILALAVSGLARFLFLKRAKQLRNC